MKHTKCIPALLAALCLLLLLSGCGAEKRHDWQPVQELTCTHPAALSALFPTDSTRFALCWSDYEALSTTVQVVDAAADTVCHQLTLDGIWDLKPQPFSDGRLALCQRDTNTWRFLSASLEETGSMSAETVDGFFSSDGSRYYFLRDRMLYCQDVSGGTADRVSLPLELRFAELTAYDPSGSLLAAQFLLSPYSTECGTALLDPGTGALTMLQTTRYQVTFNGEGMTLLSFDNEKMGYSVLCGSGDTFFFADAALFLDTGGDLYAIGGSPYLMGVSGGRSTLYGMGLQITACSLSDCGVSGEMYSACRLREDNVLVGAVYRSGGFCFYVMDPAQLSFTAMADTAPVSSPLTVDKTLSQTYWTSADAAPVAETLQQARQYADTIQEKYGVQILLSSQCQTGAALCDHPIRLSGTMDAAAELEGINRMLAALDSTLALYPEGFPAQFRDSSGDGGLCFLLVGSIEANYAIAGCTYENFDWQYVALDIQQVYRLDSIICHEIWHATENHALSCDYTLFDMDQWDALNPDGFSYTNDAASLNPQQPGTLYTGALPDIHFVDSYACVDRHEDRARIMEYFMVHDDEAQLLIQSPFIRQKLQIMCDAVRAAFDTTGWDIPRWERLL